MNTLRHTGCLGVVKGWSGVGADIDVQGRSAAFERRCRVVVWQGLNTLLGDWDAAYRRVANAVDAERSHVRWHGG